MTGGLFHRVDCGFQGGFVIDYLSDDWYYENKLVQLRGEISYVYPQRHEIGFWFNAGTNRNTVPVAVAGANGIQNINETFRATDIYAFFYRRRLPSCNGAEGRLFAGFSGENDGLIGGDLRLPLSTRVALQLGASYLIPEEAAGAGGHIGESWNLAMSLVWYPGRRLAVGRDYRRPLFNVADNGSFFVDRP